MYQGHYGLKESPFSIAPDPRYLYLSARHREALAHLIYGVGVGGGFILLTGEVGTGKTTICRCLLEQLPENVRLAYVLNPRISAIELLQTLCDELRIAMPDASSSLKALTDVIAERLMENHRRGLNTVLMIDEAQQMSSEAMEQVRLLTNLETNEKKLLQIILIGQPELLARVAQPELRQLAQRITARFHLMPLSVEEVGAYVIHRLQVAGLERSPFTNAAIRALHRYAEGIPRVINTISERALLGGFARNREKIDERMIVQAAREVLGDIQYLRINKAKIRRHSLVAASVFAVTASGALSWAFWPSPELNSAAATALVAAPSTEQNMASSVPQDAEPNLPQNGTRTLELLPTEPSNEPSQRDIFSSEIAQILAGTEPDRRGDIAAKNLMALWQLDFDSSRDGPLCPYAEANALRCESGFADVLQLLQYNVPVSIKLHSDEKGHFWVTWAAKRKDKAVLYVDHLEVEAPLEVLTRYWTGEYQLLWQTPPGYSRPLMEGMNGESIKWLTGALAIDRGEQIGAARTYFDASVAEQVKHFQRTRGLTPDGIAGTQTVLALWSAQNPHMPRLQQDGEG